MRINHINRIKDKKNLAGHNDDIISMAIGGDGKRLATGGSDKRICIWDTSSMTHLKTFSQHRGPVMVLNFLFKSNSRVLLVVHLQIKSILRARIARLNYGQ